MENVFFDLPYEAELEWLTFEQACDDHYDREMIEVERDHERGAICGSRRDELIAKFLADHDRDLEKEKARILSKYR